MRCSAAPLPLLAVLLACAPAALAGGGPSHGTTWERGGEPEFGRRGGERPEPTARTIPYWSASFTDPGNGETYPFSMVGAEPRSGRATTVPTEIVPLRLNFVAGRQDTQSLAQPEVGYAAPQPLSVSLDASGDAALTVASPVFQAYRHAALLGGDTTQAGDAFMRAQFGRIGSSYHVLLGQPRVVQAVTIDVPQRRGVAVVNPRGVLEGRVDEDWLARRVERLVGELDLDPATLPIFLTHDVVLYANDDYTSCCVIGLHGASRLSARPSKRVWTYVFAAYLTPGTFRGFGTPVGGLADVHALSHEVTEWLDDPFLDNRVQPWLAPTAGPPRGPPPPRARGPPPPGSAPPPPPPGGG